jgi:hypothetical protein
MSDFAEIPPPLYEQIDGSPTKADPEEVLSAKYTYFDDRATGESPQ